METSPTQTEVLFAKVENYINSSVLLLKLNAVKLSIELSSALIAKTIAATFIFLVFISLTFGFGLLLGEMLGKTYFGFFAIAAIYLIIGILLFVFLQKWIRKSVANFIIKKTI